MPRQIRQYRLFIASPSDTLLESQIIREVITDWNIQHGQSKGLIIEIISWHTHSYPSYGDRPQELINKQAFDSSDIIVGIFWTKFGTPTGVANSGTEEEIRRGIQMKKNVMVYFSNKPISPDKIDFSEYSKIQKFKEEFSNKGVYSTFNDELQFRDLFRQHIAAIIDEISTKSPNISYDEDPISISLSPTYWTIILASLKPIIESNLEEIEKLRVNKTKLDELPKHMTTVLAGPIVTQSIIIDELAKHGIVTGEAKLEFGFDSLVDKINKLKTKHGI